MADQSVAAEALALAVALKKPVLLWGHPGTGKTAVVHQLAEAMGEAIETVIASLREPADFAGLPVVAADGTVSLAAPGWAKRLLDAGSGVLFFDEVTTAAPSVQAALLRVVLERVVGDVALPPEVAVVAGQPARGGGRRLGSRAPARQSFLPYRLADRCRPLRGVPGRRVAGTAPGPRGAVPRDGQRHLH